MKVSAKLIAILAVVTLLAGSSFAAGTTDIGLKGIGARLGYVDLEDWDGTFNFGAVANLGTFTKYLAWDASFEYWTSSESAYGFDVAISDLALRSGVLYEFIHDSFRPHAGGGLGLHMVSAEVATIYGKASEDDSKFGIYLQGGVETDLSARWKGAADIRFDFVDNADQTHIMFTAIYLLGK